MVDKLRHANIGRDSIPMIWSDIAIAIGIILMCVPIDFFEVTHQRFRSAFDYVVVVLAVILLGHFILRMVLRWERQPFWYFAVFALSVLSIFDYFSALHGTWLPSVLGGGSVVVGLLGYVNWWIISGKTGSRWRAW